MGFNEGSFNGDSYGGFKRISVKKKRGLISVAITEIDADLIEISCTTKSVSETVSASLVVDADLTEVFYTTKSISETVSASLAVTASLTSI